MLRILLLCSLPLGFASAQSASTAPLTYNGLEPGLQLTAFLERSDTLVPREAVLCQTSPRTAAIMECGAELTRDDGRQLYLAIQVIGGTVSMVSLTDGGREGTAAYWQEHLRAEFGQGTATRRNMIQWVRGDTVARLTWRGRGDGERVSLTITHDPTMARITEYLP